MRYTPESSGPTCRKKGVRNWAALHNKLDNPYKNNNVDLPTLQPWVNTGTFGRFIFKDPFHRIDTRLRQLPYIDNGVTSWTKTLFRLGRNRPG